MTATTTRAAGDDATASHVERPLPVATGRQVRDRIVQLLRRHRVAFARTVALHVAAAIVSLGPPIVLGRLIDTIATATADAAIAVGEVVGTVDRLAIAIGVLLLAQAALTWVAYLTTGTLGEQTLAELREDFLDDAVHLPLSTVEEAGTGDLVSRASADVDAFSFSVRQAVPTIASALVLSVVIVAGAVWVSPPMALSVLVVVPVLLPAVIWYRRRSPQVFAQWRARLATMTATLNESHAGARTIEALGWQQRRVDQLDRDIEHTWDADFRIIRLRTVLFPATDLAMFLPLLAVLLIGGSLALRGTVSIGEVTTVAVLMQMLMVPMAQVILMLDALQMGNAALARLVGTGTVEPDRHPTGRAPVEETDTDIRAHGVRFGYTSDREVLHGIDLDLRRGERLALVGPTGAGKSTLARLITGIHPPHEGSVTVGGVSLMELAPEQLRARVALLTQEHHVFVGTVAENLRLAAPEATDQQLTEALARVGGGGWLAGLPDGLDTELAADHVIPTPAEAQLVALARIAVAAPPTLVLDEATSQLDAGAAQRAESALSEVLRGRTVVMIAHRLHTAHHADRIGVIEQGRLVELGTHDELIAARGAYHRLWETWHGR